MGDPSFESKPLTFEFAATQANQIVYFMKGNEVLTKNTSGDLFVIPPDLKIVIDANNFPSGWSEDEIVIGRTYGTYAGNTSITLSGVDAQDSSVVTAVNYTIPALLT